jgi:hypothetical protein
MKKILLILLLTPFISFGQTDSTIMKPYVSTSILSNIKYDAYTEIEVGLNKDDIRFGLSIDNRNFYNIGIKTSFPISKTFYIYLQPKVSFKFDEVTLTTGFEYNDKIYKNLIFILGGNIQNTAEGNLYLIHTGLRYQWN